MTHEQSPEEEKMVHPEGLANAGAASEVVGVRSPPRRPTMTPMERAAWRVALCLMTESEAYRTEQARGPAWARCFRIAVAAQVPEGESETSSRRTDGTDQPGMNNKVSTALLAAEALVEKLDAVKPYLDSMTTVQFARTGAQYSGPNYGPELAALRSALTELRS